ncbi:hypothetical protein D3C86_969930 [compost metagenome]
MGGGDRLQDGRIEAQVQAGRFHLGAGGHLQALEDAGTIARAHGREREGALGDPGEGVVAGGVGPGQVIGARDEDVGAEQGAAVGGGHPAADDAGFAKGEGAERDPRTLRDGDPGPKGFEARRVRGLDRDAAHGRIAQHECAILSCPGDGRGLVRHGGACDPVGSRVGSNGGPDDRPALGIQQTPRDQRDGLGDAVLGGTQRGLHVGWTYRAAGEG